MCIYIYISYMICICVYTYTYYVYIYRVYIILYYISFLKWGQLLFWVPWLPWQDIKEQGAGFCVMGFAGRKGATSQKDGGFLPKTKRYLKFHKQTFRGFLPNEKLPYRLGGNTSKSYISSNWMVLIMCPFGRFFESLNTGKDRHLIGSNVLEAVQLERRGCHPQFLKEI